MSENNHDCHQPLRELQWLAQYFQVHGREDLAQDLLQQLQAMRHLAQQSITQEEASNVVKFKLPPESMNGSKS